MIVLSHRGYWHESAEKNTMAAFERSFSLGFGLETDLRDRGSRIVVSHDMPASDAIPVETFFDLYKSRAPNLPLALNIKADGLQDELKRILESYAIERYFVFDMAVPDGLQYVSRGLRAYTRHSEYETSPAFYALATGVWMDEFNGRWITDEAIMGHIDAGKEVCIVSPELHRNDRAPAWAQYRALETRIGKDRFMICTDFPEEAREFFHG